MTTTLVNLIGWFQTRSVQTSQPKILLVLFIIIGAVYKFIMNYPISEGPCLCSKNEEIGRGQLK